MDVVHVIMDEIQIAENLKESETERGWRGFEAIGSTVR
jgi:hypothetical protein